MTQKLGCFILSGTDDSAQIKTAFSTLYYSGKEIFLYLLFASLLVGGLGFLSKAFVRRQRIDRKYRIFRFQNEWHYLFSAEILDFPDFAGKTEDVDMIYIDALVDCDEGSILYSGVLAEYILSKDGGLDRIFLSDTRRRYLKNDSTEGSKYYEMPGDLFVIPYGKIINLHLTYYSVEVDLTEELDGVNVHAD